MPNPYEEPQASFKVPNLNECHDAQYQLGAFKNQNLQSGLKYHVIFREKLFGTQGNSHFL